MTDPLTNTCARCGRIYDPAKPHDCADRTAFTHGLGHPSDATLAALTPRPADVPRDPEVPTVEDLTAYIDMALIQWVADDYGLARHIAESIHPRLVPVSPSVDPEEG